MTKKKATAILKFASEADEAAWWDSHPDFIADQFEKAAKEGKLLRSGPETQSVTIRIASKDVATARKLAAEKGLPYQSYIKALLHRALQRERKTG